MDVEEKVPDNTYSTGRQRSRSGTVALILAFIPGVFGLMGLGLMYLGAYIRGLIFLILGLPTMLVMVLLIRSISSSVVWSIIALGFVIILGIGFIILFAIQILMTIALSSTRPQ